MNRTISSGHGHIPCCCFLLVQAPVVPIQQPSKDQDFDLDALLGDLESFDPLANSAAPTSPVTLSHPPTPPVPAQLHKDRGQV